MKFNPCDDRNASIITVTGSANCDTDSMPLVPQVFFRHYLGAYDPEYGTLAGAILFARHCGSVADFASVKIGIDAARAIRAIVPDVEDVLPIDGMKREIGKGTAALVVGEACQMFGGAAISSVGRAARAVTWSGDFVTAGTRNSAGYIGGDVFTNALLVAGSTSISVALALLIAGRSLRDIYVPAPPEAEADDLARLSAGLAFVSIKLRTL